MVYRPKQPLNQKHFTQENGQLKIDELPENNVWENLKDTLSKATRKAYFDRCVSLPCIKARSFPDNMHPHLL